MGNLTTKNIKTNIYAKKLNEVTIKELEMMMSRTRSGQNRIMYPFYQQALSQSSTSVTAKKASKQPSTSATAKKASKEDFQKFLQLHHNSSCIEFFHAYKTKPSFWRYLRSREFSQEADFLEDFAQLENCKHMDQACGQFKKIFYTYIANGSKKKIHLPAMEVEEKLHPLLELGLDDASGRTESSTSEETLSTEFLAFNYNPVNANVRSLVCGTASYEGKIVTFVEC